MDFIMHRNQFYQVFVFLSACIYIYVCKYFKQNRDIICVEISSILSLTQEKSSKSMLTCEKTTAVKILVPYKYNCPVIYTIL